MGNAVKVHLKMKNSGIGGSFYIGIIINDADWNDWKILVSCSRTVPPQPHTSADTRSLDDNSQPNSRHYYGDGRGSSIGVKIQ